jgi:hypothetical protein
MVTDAEGDPVPGATVFLGGALRPRAATSASDGSFELTNVPVGRWVLLACKESAGYPPIPSTFFYMPGEEFPEVEVRRNAMAEGANIRLGAKAAYLDFDISDGTGRPESATVYFWRPDHDKGPDDWSYSVHADAHQKGVPVPPVPFGIKVEAEGFEPWVRGGGGSRTQQGFLRPKSGETRLLRIRLKRIQ